MQELCNPVEDAFRLAGSAFDPIELRRKYWPETYDGLLWPFALAPHRAHAMQRHAADKEEAQETRALIMDTAEVVLREKGAHLPGGDRPAGGGDAGAIYWHFENKADLFTAMCGRTMLPPGVRDPESHANTPANWRPPCSAARNAGKACARCSGCSGKCPPVQPGTRRPRPGPGRHGAGGADQQTDPRLGPGAPGLFTGRTGWTDSGSLFLRNGRRSRVK